jgi:hypothetical protein
MKNLYESIESNDSFDKSSFKYSFSFLVKIILTIQTSPTSGIKGSSVKTVLLVINVI